MSINRQSTNLQTVDPAREQTADSRPAMPLFGSVTRHVFFASRQIRRMQPCGHTGLIQLSSAWIGSFDRHDQERRKASIAINPLPACFRHFDTHNTPCFLWSTMDMAPWDELDEELVGEIVRHSDRIMWSPMEHVCRKWRRAVVGVRSTDKRWSPAAWREHSVTARQARGVDDSEPYFAVCGWRKDAVSSGRWRWTRIVAHNGWLSLLKWAHALDRLCAEPAGKEAASTGNLPLLEWLASVGACICEGALINAAAEAGHVHILEWLYAMGHRPRCTYTCEAAARTGQLVALQWLRAHGCRWDLRTCAAAAQGGHLDVLKWARANGCKWDHLTTTCTDADNHLTVLAWALSQGCPRDDGSVLAGLAKGGHLAILQWLVASGYRYDTDMTTRAAERGHLHVLEWARTIGCPWDAWTCAAAAGAGHLEVLKWLRANGCRWDGLTCRHAATEGHLDIVRWARTHGCPWDEHTCASVAATGRLDVLKWLRDQGCPWGVGTCSEAAHKGHLHILDWAVKNGCPWSPAVCLYDARRRDQHHVIMWIVDVRDGITPRHLPGLVD